MIFKQTKFVPSDRCGVWLVRTFHTYTYVRRFAKMGEFIKISIQQTRPFNRLRKKKKNKSFVVRTSFWLRKLDASWYYFGHNSGVLLKKRLHARGKKVYGPISTTIRRRKMLLAFNRVL